MNFKSIKDIERVYHVEDIKIRDEFVWPIIRLKLHERLRDREGLRSRTISINRSTIWILLSCFFYGISSFYKIFSSDYWFFSSSERRKLRNGFYKDRVIENAVSICENSIVIENPFPIGTHYSRKLIANEHIISQSFFFIGIGCFRFFLKLFCKFDIQKEDFLFKIYNDYSISVDHHGLIRNYFAQYYFVRFLLNFSKVKTVFIVYSASSMGYIKAFRSKGIKVVELQHGIINKEHMAYNIHKDFGFEYFPEFLLTYGHTERSVFHNDNFFINSNSVFPVGSSSLAERVNAMIPYFYFPSKYKLIVAFSFQEPFEDLAFNFLNLAGQIDQSILYLVIPRSTKYKFIGVLEDNVQISYEFDIYDALQICDVHVTINSTCALEAFSFGKGTCLMDINGYSSTYFKNIFSDVVGVEFVKSPEDLVLAIRKMANVDREKVREVGNLFFISDYNTHFKKFLKLIS